MLGMKRKAAKRTVGLRKVSKANKKAHDEADMRLHKAAKDRMATSRKKDARLRTAAKRRRR